MGGGWGKDNSLGIMAVIPTDPCVAAADMSEAPEYSSIPQ